LPIRQLNLELFHVGGKILVYITEKIMKKQPSPLELKKNPCCYRDATCYQAGYYV